jgi:hypothetical protein
MDIDNQRTISGTHCCDKWWGSLTPVQKMWLHTHLWDIEILAGWTSDVMVQTLGSLHSQQVARYAPAYINGHSNGLTPTGTRIT